MPGANRKIIICGGDSRELELYRCWKKRGLSVKAAGFEQVAGIDQAAGQDFKGAAVLIAPLSGINAGGYVKAPFAGGELDLMACLGKSPPQVTLLTGSAPAPLMEELDRRTSLVITMEDEELALLNAIPTAEGAAQRAMELSRITIHGSSALIFGLGRCGSALARVLRGLGAAVTAAVRRKESAALAYSAGLGSCNLREAAEAAARSDFIFNTVPAPVLTALFLQQVKKGAIILDLASAPGGTDFAAASRLGLKAELLPGLPGRVAPETSGQILDAVYRRLIAHTGD